MFPDEEIKYERILHTIWNEQLIEQKALATVCGKAVTVVRPGFINPSDGPDFVNAAVQIGAVTHYGAIEIHLNSRDWNAHHHQSDTNYNNVVLHVVADAGNVLPIRTQNGDEIPTLNIRSFIPKQIDELINALEGNNLPCSNIITYISDEAFEEQLAIAQQEYLEKKVRDFYSFYDPSQVMSLSWKQALMVSLADGLGIPHNRDSMVKAARYWLAHTDEGRGFTSDTHFMNAILEKSGIMFSRKGVRPAHRPEQRLLQLHHLLTALHETAFSSFLDQELSVHWQQLLVTAGISKQGFSKILYGTVFLPAHLSLSQLVFSTTLRQQVFEEWQQLKVQVPDLIRKKFAIFPKQLYTQTKGNLGAVHLYHAYCKEKRCMECKVLNKAILS